MLKILWKRGKIAPEEQFLPLSTIFYYLILDFYVKTGIRFSLRDKRLFEITEVEITRVDCSYVVHFVPLSAGLHGLFLLHVHVVVIASHYLDLQQYCGEIAAQ